jgi:hypothetical protein
MESSILSEVDDTSILRTGLPRRYACPLNWLPASRLAPRAAGWSAATLCHDPRETSWKRGARQPPVCRRLAAPGRRSLDDEGRFEGHGPGHVVEIGRGCHHRLVDLGELFLSAATLDADDVAQVLVPRRHSFLPHHITC